MKKWGRSERRQDVFVAHSLAVIHQDDQMMDGKVIFRMTARTPTSQLVTGLCPANKGSDNSIRTRQPKERNRWRR